MISLRRVWGNAAMTACCTWRSCGSLVACIVLCALCFSVQLTGQNRFLACLFFILKDYFRNCSGERVLHGVERTDGCPDSFMPGFLLSVPGRVLLQLLGERVLHGVERTDGCAFPCIHPNIARPQPLSECFTAFAQEILRDLVHSDPEWKVC